MDAVDAVDVTMTEQEDADMEAEVEATEMEEEVGTVAEMIVTTVEAAISIADMKGVGAEEAVTMMGVAVDTVVLLEAEAMSGRIQKATNLAQKSNFSHQVILMC